MPIHRCVEYTDYSLRRFFETISRMPWYHNTLFVITADHTSSNILAPEYRTGWGLYSIPIIFFKPDNSLSSMEADIVQQVDIMPSVLGYLHYKKPYIAFGRDIFRELTPPVAFNYKDNAYQIFEDGFLLVFDGTRSLGLFNFMEDKLMKKNLLNEQPERLRKMEDRIKAVIQQYNNRLIGNNLTMESDRARLP